MQHHFALTQVRDEDLKKLLKLLYQNKIVCPLRKHTLMSYGLNTIADYAEILLYLDQKAVQAIIITALAERRKSHTHIQRLQSALQRHHEEEDRQNESMAHVLGSTQGNLPKP